MKEKNPLRFRIACWQDAIRAFFRFIKFLPGFYRLNRFWGENPKYYGWVIRQYVTVMDTLTGGKLKNPSHDAMTVCNEIWRHMNRHYAGWKKDSGA